MTVFENVHLFLDLLQIFWLKCYIYYEKSETGDWISFQFWPSLQAYNDV